MGIELKLKNHRFAYPVLDLSHACHLACEIRDASGMDSAEWYAKGPWIITDAQGTTVAHVSYNGRAWDRNTSGPDWKQAVSLCDAGLGYVTPTRMITDAERLLDGATNPAQKRAAQMALARAHDAQDWLLTGKGRFTGYAEYVK